VQLRPNAVSFASEPQTHAFNTPYQLSLIPPEILARQRAFGGEPLMDTPANASVTTHRVRHGDVFVFASDGVWDNLSPSDVLGIVTEYMVGFAGWRLDAAGGGGTRAMVVAQELADITEDGGIGTFERTIQALLAVAVAGEAKIASLNQKRDGPFARELKRYYPHEDWHGGKVDDICVVVAVVVQK
jgi:protein phosphatase PTC7